MSAASSIGGLLNQQATQSTRGGGFSDLTSDEFLKVMITELTNQDPLQPNDSQALLEQMSSLRNIESQSALQDALESLVLQNNIAQAGSMIGRQVAGVDLQNNTVSGVVTSVRVVDGKAELELDSGRTLSLDRVTRVSEAVTG